MGLPLSTQTLRWPPPASGGAPVFLCHGDSDEHLRLSVLIASVLGTTATADAVTTACCPRSSWKERSRALQEILARAEPSTSGGLVGVLVDLDAAVHATGSTELAWDDATFRTERREFIETVLDAVAAGGWLLVRPDPCVALSLRLEDVGALDEAWGTSSIEPSAEPSAFSAVAQGIVASLLDQRMLDHTDLERWEQQDDPVSEIIDFAIDRIGEESLTVGARLSHERAPLDINGRCGPFAWADARAESFAVQRSAVDTLTRGGLLLRVDPGSPSRRWMPRAIRQAFAARNREQSADLHHELSLRRGTTTPEESIEAHWHAVMAGDVERATATAQYYVNDLREIAKSFSSARRWREAADVYARILDSDASDVYAWEYRGYNLARLDEESSAPRHEHDIERAYARAHELAPSNPLYHGRMLGFALQHQAATVDEAHRVCAYYRHIYGQSAVEWFGWQVVQGLRRRGDRELASAFSMRWRIDGPVAAHKLPRRFGAGPRGIEISSDFDDPLPPPFGAISRC